MYYEFTELLSKFSAIYNQKFFARFLFAVGEPVEIDTSRLVGEPFAADAVSEIGAVRAICIKLMK